MERQLTHHVERTVGKIRFRYSIRLLDNVQQRQRTWR
jgi:hypothetical protein